MGTFDIYSVEETKQLIREKGTIVSMLACPIGATYFSKFLATEMNLDNLQCYFDCKSLLDLCNNRTKFHSDIDKLTANMEEETNNSTNVTLHKSYNVLKNNLNKNREYDEYLVNRIEKFVKRYINESSEAEVNIDASLRRNLKQHSQNIKEFRQKIIEKQDLDDGSHFKELLNIFGSFLEKLSTNLLADMNNSFIRFKTSPLFEETLTVFLSSGNGELQRKKLLNANKGGIVLNMNVKWEQSARSPLTVVSSLIKILKDLVTVEYLWIWDNDLNTIKFNIAQIHSGVENGYWRKVSDSTSELSKVDLSLLKTDEEKIAFWINTFNLMMMHAILVAQDIPVLDVPREIFFRKTRYNIGGHEYSLQDIREGILLGNQSECILFNKLIKKNDPRSRNIIEKPTILSLFGLTELLPQSLEIEVIESNNLYAQLTQLTRRYLDNFIFLEQDKRLIAPLVLTQKKDLFKKFAIENNIPAKNSEEAVVNFVKTYASYFKDKNHDDISISFEKPKPFVTNIACMLRSDNRQTLEQKLRSKHQTTAVLLEEEEQDTHNKQSEINASSKQCLIM